MKSTVKEEPVNESLLWFGVDAKEIIEQEKEVDKETNSARIQKQAREWIKKYT